MKKCIKCGKKGLFLKIDTNGICPDCERLYQIEQKVSAQNNILNKLKNEISNVEAYKETIKADALSSIEKIIVGKKLDVSALDNCKALKTEEISTIDNSIEKSTKQLNTNTKKILKLKDIHRSIEYSISNFYNHYVNADEFIVNEFDKAILDNLDPTVQLPLHCLDVRDLRKLYKENEKQIQVVLDAYKGKYSTKANITIYKLMVIALNAELQNILYKINYGKLDKAILDVKAVTSKYLKIASDGNQNIVNTITKFIGQIEYLFIKAVEIEYEYFTQKEKIKEEQRTLREQMKQEAEERKALEQQQKQIEKEESKYTTEIDNLRLQLSKSNDEASIKLNEKIKQLENQLKEAYEKKAEITKLQNGKAGYVYIISNLGSYGDSTFKIGMTRRLEPQDRVNELSNASVPFPFDVHSFIFSNDAVNLENTLHKLLHSKRMNKVNLRKEFFNISIDQIENIVTDIEPTCEFKKTMLAEQYNQTLSLTTDFDFNDNIVNDEVAADILSD